MSGPLKYRLVVADVDGTLVEHGGQIPDAVFQAVEALRRVGGRLTLATGRPVEGARRFVEELGLDLPLIVFNGSLIYDYHAEATLRQVTLPFEMALAATRLARDYPVDVFLYRGRDILVREVTDAVRGYMAKDRVRCTAVGDLASYLESEQFSPPKLLFIGDTAVSVRMMEELRALGFPEVNYVQSDASYIELLPPGSSKGEALRWLAGYLGVPLSAVMAIGDNHNDLEMVRSAGLGVAVANAQAVLQREASLVTSAPCGFGVAEAINLLVQGKI